MIFTNQLSRMLGRDVINLGFGGQGTMDPSIGRLIAEMKQVRNSRPLSSIHARVIFHLESSIWIAMSQPHV
jgi:hypothetical protein